MKSYSANGHDYVKILQSSILLLSCLTLLSVSAAFGQKGGNASLYGTVTDSTGAVIIGAKVTVTNLGTSISWTSVSDASGNYVFPDLPIGRYKVNVQHDGFGPYEATGISVVVAQNARVDPVMQVGTTLKTISVSAGAPLVDTVSAASKTTVERQFIDQLPLIDRDVHALEVIQAGTSNGTAFNELSVNGTRGGQNEWQLDGLTVNNPQYYQMMHNRDPLGLLPSPDAVQEFTLVRNGYEAQYGRTAGGQVIVATRSGTNQYHGSAFDYLRNNALTARSFFAANKAPYKRNIFGGTLGGPIRREKLFFFGSYQGTRTRANPNAGTQNVVPTQAQRNGDFSALAQPIIDPTTGLPFSGNLIPSGRLSPITQKFMNALVPLPNGPNGQLVFAPTTNTNVDQEVGKIDAVLSSKDHLSGTLFITRNSILSQLSIPTLFTNKTTPNTTITINETHSFSPHLLNDFTIGGSHFGWVTAPRAGSPTMADFGATYFIPPINHMIFVAVTGNLLASNNAPSIRPGQMLQAADNIHWIRGSHTFVFGVSATQGMSWTTTGNLASGGFYFNGFATGNPVADFVLGLSSQFSQGQTAYIPHMGRDLAAYAQDTWRVKRGLTVNYGLRYVPTWYESNRAGTQTFFYPGVQSTVFPTAPQGLVYRGDPGVDNNWYHSPDFRVLEPRIGIAWTPFGHSNWVVRSAFGMFHQQPMTLNVSNDLTWPNTLNVAMPTPPSMVNPFQGQVDPYPFNPVSPTAPLSVRQALVPPALLTAGEAFSRDVKVPTSLQWNFTIQRQLGSHDGIEVAYVGSHTYRVFSTNDGNPPIYIPGQCGAQPCSTASNVNSRRPYAGLGLVYVDYTNAMSNYNSFQLTYRHEVGYGLTLLANYTNSRTMTMATGDADGATNFWNPFNFQANYGIAGYDVPQVVNVAYAWTLPWFASGQGIGRRLVKGWTVAGYLNLRGGIPLTVYAGADRSLSAEGGDHADWIGNWQLAGGRSRGEQIAQWFNTKAFAMPAIGTYGNAGNSIMRGPGGRYWDMSFFRDFPIGERIRLQYRLDGSNIFNHPVLLAPNTTISSSAFGTIGATSDPRILQMALRLVF